MGVKERIARNGREALYALEQSARNLAKPLDIDKLLSRVRAWMPR